MPKTEKMFAVTHHTINGEATLIAICPYDEAIHEANARANHPHYPGWITVTRVYHWVDNS